MVDAPGLFDADRTSLEVKIEIAKTLSTFPHGVDAFIYVMNSTDLFTDEDQRSIKRFKVLYHSATLGERKTKNDARNIKKN